MADSSMTYNWQLFTSCGQAKEGFLVRGPKIDGTDTVSKCSLYRVELSGGLILTDNNLEGKEYQIKQPDSGPSMLAPKGTEKYLDNPPK